MNDSSDEKSKGYFINTADWLVKHAKVKETSDIDYTLWPYNFPWPFYEGLDLPYASALAQSAGIHILILVHNMTGDEKYLEAADKAFGSFLVEYDKGGVATMEGGNEEEQEQDDDSGIGGSSINNGDDSMFLQEIAKPEYEKTYILNGHIFSLIDLWNYYEYTHNENAAAFFNKGLNYLKDNL